MFNAIALGTILGFVSAIPVAGPVSALVFSYGMKNQGSKGRWVAMGAGFAEAVYCFIAFWGFNHFLVDLTTVIRISNWVAAAILIFLGIYFYRSKKMREPHAASERKRRSQNGFFMGAGISFLNPTLIATWTAAMTTMYSLKPFEFSTLNGVGFSAGVWIGIVLWFSWMLQLMHRHRNRLDPHILDRGLKGIGIGLGVLAVWMLLK